MSGIVVLLFFTELDQTDNKRQSNKANIILLYANYYTVSHVYREIELNR